MIRARRTVPGLCLVLACSTGCSEGEDFPTKNWSGRYATRIVESSTTCADFEEPPAMPGFILDLTHHADNRATFQMNPIVTLEGAFEGDRARASMEVQEPVSLPDSILARVSAADSIDLIQYSLSAAFSNVGFEGTYIVRSPDVHALVSRGQGGRCDFRYELSGQVFTTATGG